MMYDYCYYYLLFIYYFCLGVYYMTTVLFVFIVYFRSNYYLFIYLFMYLFIYYFFFYKASEIISEISLINCKVLQLTYSSIF